MQKQCDNVILELTVRNHPGVMTHVCGLFARRAFNVEGILCLPIQDSDKSHIWLLVNDDQRLEQMISQIDKLEDVVKATQLAGKSTWEPFYFAVVCGVIYLVFTTVSNGVLLYLERRYSVGVKRADL